MMNGPQYSLAVELLERAVAVMGVFVLRGRDDEAWGERESCFVVVSSEGSR
jgi:hypothetical protein